MSDEFKVGDKIRVKKLGLTGKIVGRLRITDAWVIRFDEGNLLDWFYRNELEKIEETPTFKIGDKVRVNAPGYRFYGYEGRILGIHALTDYWAIQYEDTIMDHWPSHCLEKIEEPKPLEIGQEIWVKAIFDAFRSDCCTKESIYIKNAEGQIVPYLEDNS